MECPNNYNTQYVSSLYEIFFNHVLKQLNVSYIMMVIWRGRENTKTNKLLLENIVNF